MKSSNRSNSRQFTGSPTRLLNEVRERVAQHALGMTPKQIRNGSAATVAAIDAYILDVLTVSIKAASEVRESVMRNTEEANPQLLVVNLAA